MKIVIVKTLYGVAIDRLSGYLRVMLLCNDGVVAVSQPFIPAIVWIPVFECGLGFRIDLFKGIGTDFGGSEVPLPLRLFVAGY